MPPESRELAMLQGAVALLQAMTAASPTTYNFIPDEAFLVDAPQIKHLGEFTHAYFVSPGDVIYAADTGCQVRSEGDFLVTGVRRHTASELPWDGDYIATVATKLKMVADLILALNGQSPGGILVTITGRNVSLEVDGWAVVQVQFGFTDSQAGSLA